MPPEAPTMLSPARGMATDPDAAVRAAREFITTRTVAETLAGFRPGRRTPAETVPLAEALHRVPAAAVTAPHALPGFARSTVDGYAVRAADTYGVSDGLPGYLQVTGAVRMGAEPDVTVIPGTAASMPARPRVTVFSTGDEVVPPGAAALRPGQVRDASAVALAAMVAEAGGEPAPGGIVPDDPEALDRALRAALTASDLIVISAGS